MIAYSGTLSGLLYALVATQLPYAPIIGIAVFWSVAGTIFYLLWKQGDLNIRRRATRPIPQIYAWSTSLAFILTVIWTGIKGIKGRNLD